jgi:hypothetical protein
VVCDTRLKPKQTIKERAEEVRRAVATLARDLASGRVKAKVSKEGAVAFEGWAAADRDAVTDNCAYRRLMSSGSALALAKIAQAEALAGRKVDRAVVNSGLHSHDNGVTWHSHKK